MESHRRWIPTVGVDADTVRKQRGLTKKLRTLRVRTSKYQLRDESSRDYWLYGAHSHTVYMRGEQSSLSMRRRWHGAGME